MNKFLSAKYSGARKGQVAIAILFLVLIALIFYAVTMNIGNMAQTKALVTTASNLATARLASLTVSTAQQMLKVNLGGKNPRCGLTGAFSALIGVVLAIIGAVLALFTGGGSVALCVIGIAMAAGGLVIQTAFVEPMITNAWTKMMEKSLTTNERYIEQALEIALQNAITDAKRIEDLTDMNGNARFKGSPKGSDKVSRFAILYDQRIRSLSGGAYFEAIDYLNKLDNFVYGGGNINDKPGIECQPGIGDALVIGNSSPPPIPSECNPCCLPTTLSDTGDSWGPADCSGKDGGPTSGTCGAATPYPGYSDIFDRNYQNIHNSKYSFLEQVGRDDEHPSFNRRFFEASLDEDKDYNDVAQLDVDTDIPPDGIPDNEPEDYYDRWGHPNQIPQRNLGLRTAPTKFYFGDADGYYSKDLRRGVFPFFWQMKHFGVDLNSLRKTSRMYPECVWCDPNDPKNVFTDVDLNLDSDGDGNPSNDHDEGSVCSPCYPDMIVYNSSGNGIGGGQRVNQLSLGSMDGIIFEKNYYVDGPADSVGGEPPVGMDIVNETNETYVNLMKVNNSSSDVWREGSEFYSSAEWPYQYPEYYQENQMDRMDWITYGLQEYLTWATYVLSNKQYAASQMKRWDDAQEEGRVEFWRKRLVSLSVAISDVLRKTRKWKEQTYFTSGCGEAWCIPGDPGACSSPVPSEELKTFGAGKIENVAECLEWNSGNAARFSNCLSQCTVEACTDLPRSLVPDFDPNIDPIVFGGDCNQTSFDPDCAVLACDPNFDLDCDGICDNPAAKWANNMRQSIIEAEKQGIKMSMRAAFLRSLIARRENLIDVLDPGLESVNQMAGVPSPNAPIPTDRTVIYGWQDDPNEALGVDGRWHYVKVEASLPNLLPWIKTYSKGIFKAKRCYELTNTKGDVWVKVTRFDQPFSKSEEAKLKVNYGGGLLWKFWTYDPAKAVALAKLDLSGIPELCKNVYAHNYKGEIIDRAFITDSSSGGSCAAAVEKALEYGVSTTTCAEYDYQGASGGANAGFAFKFSKCK